MLLNGSRALPRVDAGFDRFPFVVLLFSFSDRDFELDPAFFKISRKRDDRKTFLGGYAVKAIDLGPFEK